MIEITESSFIGQNVFFIGAICLVGTFFIVFYKLFEVQRKIISICQPMDYSIKKNLFEIDTKFLNKIFDMLDYVYWQRNQFNNGSKVAVTSHRVFAFIRKLIIINSSTDESASIHAVWLYVLKEKHKHFKRISMAYGGLDGIIQL